MFCIAILIKPTLKLAKKITNFTEIFYRDETNWVLTSFWNSLFIAFFLLPLGINLPTPFFIISIILGIIHIFRSKKNFVFENKALLLFPIYFIILTCSLLYSTNLSGGLLIIQRSLSLLLFPIIFLFVKEDASTVKRLFDFLLYGVLLSFFINLVITLHSAFSLSLDAAKIFSIENLTTILDSLVIGWDRFTGTGFSQLINPSYVSLYILLVLSYYLKKELNSKIRIFVVITLFLYLFLLSSRAAYFIMLIMSVLLLLDIKDKSKKHTMFIIFIMGIIIFFNNPRIFDFYSRVKDFKSTKSYDAKTIEKSRLLTWDASLQLIKEAPLLGYGIGDANDILIEKYKELGYDYNYKNKYNAHNQFLQTMLQTGIVGCAVLISIFIVLGYRMNRSRNEFSVFLILLVSLLFESMLVRFNGIVFFSIITPLLLKERSILSGRIIRNISIEK